MVEIILITGGARSGKSRHARQLAESLKGKKLFVATSPVTDPEMHLRIERHREERTGSDWHTVEETVDLDEVLIANREYEVVLIDCLTLWVNNLLFTDAGNELTEELLADKTRKVIEACRGGRCNQEIAAAADKVIMTICGIPMTVKEKI